jgi:predicted nucleic acid-binding Zn ribbon protein
MGNLGDVFEKRLSQLGIKKQVDAALVCDAFDKAVLEVFGEKGAKSVRAISFKNDVLKVGVSSSSWANEINLRQKELGKRKKLRIIFKYE